MNDRVPPGQHLVSGFPVVHVGPVPPFDPTTWRLRVFGLVAETRSYPYAEITSGPLWPRTTVQTDLHCVTTWSKLDNIWEGVKLTDLLAGVQLQPEARYVMAHCAHGYTTNIPLADLKRDDVL
jgi:DMSO/TMAO reductase YedYZ molybdopterin-dependent catalytic subunit